MKRWDDLIFLQKNTSYGAYQVRRASEKGLRWGFFLQLFLALGFGVGAHWWTLQQDLETVVPDGPPVYIPPEVVQPVEEKPEKTAEIPKKEKNQKSEQLALAKEVKDAPTPKPTPIPPTENLAQADTLGKNDEKQEGAKVDSNQVSILAETRDPAFPGGFDSLIRYLHATVERPTSVKKVYAAFTVSFVIDTNGKVQKVDVGTTGYPLYRQIVRASIQNMPPWSPGKKEGHPFEARMTLPVIFNEKLKP
jgi:periplasmic protein TonB